MRSNISTPGVSVEDLTPAIAATLKSDDVLTRLESSTHGLTSDEAGRRRARYGLNAVRAGDRSFPAIIGEQARNGFNILLAIAGLLTFAIGDPTDGAIILVLLFLNIGLSIFQEYRAERALERRSSTHAA